MVGNVLRFTYEWVIKVYFTYSLLIDNEGGEMT